MVQMQAGAAEKGCVEAKRLLGVCQSAADGDAGWRGVLEQEMREVERKR